VSEWDEPLGVLDLKFAVPVNQFNCRTGKQCSRTGTGIWKACSQKYHHIVFFFLLGANTTWAMKSKPGMRLPGTAGHQGAGDQIGLIQAQIVLALRVGSSLESSRRKTAWALRE